MAAAAAAAQAPCVGVTGALLKRMKITMVLQEAVNQLKCGLITDRFKPTSVTVFFASDGTFVASSSWLISKSLLETKLLLWPLGNG